VSRGRRLGPPSKGRLEDGIPLSDYVEDSEGFGVLAASS
jgi:hypothetical protein